MAWSGCGTTPEPAAEDRRADGPTLITEHEYSEEGMYAIVRGTLAVNSRDCFTVDDHVLVAGKGSRVVEGSRAGGGYIEGVGEVTNFAEHSDLVDEIMGCQPDPQRPSIVVVHPGL